MAPPASPLGNRVETLGLTPPEGPWREIASANPIRGLRGFRWLRKQARSGNVVGVIAHTGRGHAAGAFAVKGLPVPLLRVRSEIRRPAGGPVQRWLYGKATDRVLLSGEFMRQWHLDRLRIPSEKLLTIPAGIDCGVTDRIHRPSSSARLRAACRWPERAIVIGMLARYSPVKGHRTLVEAARLLLGKGHDVYFYLAGPEGQIGREEVERWIWAAGIGARFVVADQIEDPLDVAAGFDIALILSEGSEAVCRSALEYMALGLPIIATRVNVIPETVGRAAILIRPGDPLALAEAIDQFLGSPDRALALGREAYDRVREEFDIRRTAAETLRVLRDAQTERHGNA